MSRLGPGVLDLQREARGRGHEGQGAGDTEEEEPQEQHSGALVDSLKNISIIWINKTLSLKCERTLSI